MPPLTRSGPAVLVGLLATAGPLACAAARSDRGDGEEASPWDDLEPIDLEALRPLLRTSLTSAVSPARLVSLPDVPLSFALDPGAGRVWALDARYRHHPDPVCTDASLWPELDPDGERQGGCASGKVEATRGALHPGSAVIAMAVDTEDPGIWLLGVDGGLARANLDPLEGNPLDFSRPEHVAVLDLAASTAWVAPAWDGGLWLADGTRLRQLDAAGEVLAEARLDEPIVDLTATSTGAWILGTGGLWTWDGATMTLIRAVDGHDGRLARGDDRACASLPAEGRVLCSDGEEVAVEGLRGPLAVGRSTLWVVTEDGLLTLVDGQEPSLHEVDPVEDLQVQATGEVALLHADHTVGVYVDETGLAGPAPLNATLITFLENPKVHRGAEVCYDAATLESLFALAHDNTVLLDDLPSPVALGVTAEVASQARLCGREEELGRIWQRRTVSTGLLIAGEQETDLVDQDTITALLLDQSTQFSRIDLPMAWISNAHRLGDAGADWVDALEQTALVSDLLFFGLDLLPEVSRWDPRAKDPMPWRSDQSLTAWQPSSGQDPLTDEPSGTLWLRPGSTLSLYSQGGCANLFLFECKQSDQGGSTRIDEQDLQVLDLLLWRALVMRSAEGPDHWSFHLPDISVTDYTEGCRRSGGRWTAVTEGEQCQAEALQGWIFDVHARYALSGLLAWWLPAG